MIIKVKGSSRNRILESESSVNQVTAAPRSTSIFGSSSLRGRSPAVIYPRLYLSLPPPPLISKTRIFNLDLAVAQARALRKKFTIHGYKFEVQRYKVPGNDLQKSMSLDLMTVFGVRFYYRLAMRWLICFRARMINDCPFFFFKTNVYQKL